MAYAGQCSDTGEVTLDREPLIQVNGLPETFDDLTKPIARSNLEQGLPRTPLQH